LILKEILKTLWWQNFFSRAQKFWRIYWDWSNCFRDYQQGRAN